MKNMKSFLLGVSATLLIGSVGVSALAVTTQKTVTIFPGVQIYLDDTLLDPRDVNGNPVEVFVYNGTTYLPVRAISEALEKPVQWEGSTRSVYLGKHSSNKPAVMLKDLDYFVYEFDEFDTLTTDKDNLGNRYLDSIRGDWWYSTTSETYKINGQYSSIRGTFYQRYDERSSTGYEPTLLIYGDGDLLYSATVGAGIEPVDFAVDISGVLELRVELSDASDHAAIGNCGLYT